MLDFNDIKSFKRELLTLSDSALESLHIEIEYILVRLEELCLLYRDIDRFWNEIVFPDVGDGRHEGDDWSEGNYGNYDDDDDDDDDDLS
jgi:hypothetical protein